MSMILDSPAVDQAITECDPPLIAPQCTETNCTICNPCLALYTPPSPESLPSNRSRRASSAEGRPPARRTQSEPAAAAPRVTVKIRVELEVGGEVDVEITRPGVDGDGGSGAGYGQSSHAG